MGADRLRGHMTAAPAPPRARPLPGRGGGDGEVLKAIRPRGGPASEWVGARSATAPGSFRPRRPPACVSAGRAGAAAGAPSAGSPPPWVSRGGNREGGRRRRGGGGNFSAPDSGAEWGCARRVRRPLARGRAPPRAPPPVAGGGPRGPCIWWWRRRSPGAPPTERGKGGPPLPRPLGPAAATPPTTPPPGDSCECGGEDGSQRDRRRSRWAGVGRRVGGYVPRLGWREWPLGVHVWAL